MEKMTKQLAQRPEDPEAGAFIGFDSSNESDLSQDEVYDDMQLRMFLNFFNYHIDNYFAYIFLAEWKQYFISGQFVRWIIDVAR